LAVSLVLAHAALAATTNEFRNVTTISNATVDATTVINEGSISYVDSIGFLSWQVYNTLRFINQASGSLFLDPGFRFETVTNNVRQRAETFVNEGFISLGNAFFAQFGPTNFFATSAGGHLNINATNIYNAGIIGAGHGGLLRFQGNTVNMSRSISAVGQPSGLFSGLFGTTNYFNAYAVKDIWWAVGTNQVLTPPPSPLNLPFLASSLDSQFPFSPTHEVDSASFIFPLVTLPYQFFAGAQTHTFIRRANVSNYFVTVAVVCTNGLETNIATQVGFRGVGRVPEVEFSFRDVDIITGLPYTNYITLMDRLAASTNVALARNLDATSFKPANYELYRSFSSQLFGAPSNSTLTNVTLDIGPPGFPINVTFPNIIYDPLFTNSIITNTYTAWGAEVGSVANSPFFAPRTNTNQALTDPTNLPGRIELITHNLDLNLAKVRAESTLIVQTTNLISQAGSVLDAPVIKYDIATASGTVALTNFLPATVRRWNGQVFVYSTFWTNVIPAVPAAGLSNNVTFTYNLAFVDGSSLNSIQDVDLPSLAVKGTNVVLGNRLNASRTFVVDSPSITLNASNQLFLSFNTTNIPDLTASNFPSVAWFTNHGLISIRNQGFFGSDRSGPWSNMVNSGSISGIGHTVRVREFENSGSITASGGPLNIEVENAKLESVTNTGSLATFGALTFSNSTLKVRNHRFTSSAGISFNVTNLLTDNGPGASNVFRAALGFSLQRLPAQSALLGTTLESVTPVNRLVPHVWAGLDQGARPAGFTNNAAVGHLVLNPGTNSLLSFRALAASGVTNAIYVDFLELQGFALTNLSNYLAINSNFTLYFATANTAVTNLDGAFGGRLRWVRHYAGPHSGVDVLMPDGRIVKVNRDLLASRELDTDNDGIPNGLDASPFDGAVLRSAVTFTNVPPLSAQITWDAAANTDYEIEIATALTPPDWQRLVVITNTAAKNGPVTYTDPLPTNAVQRFYRVLYRP
jgi:hypothetical protein